ncbi:MAG: ABC transporter ATP-binding protein [Candidatus Dojkabacteria bacterium]
MNYELSNDEKKQASVKFGAAVKALYQHIRNSKWKMSLAFLFLIIVSVTTIVSPYIIGDVTNKYIPVGDTENLGKALILLAIIYIIGSAFSYLQIRVMGQVGQKILFNIRNAVFQKLQSLPLQFFNQNKSGDLISRINNDTDKMNQAFSETLLRFTGDVIVIIGIAIVMLALNVQLGLIALATLVVMLAITAVLSGFIKSRNDRSLQKLGELSGSIQESLTNFKVTVVFNRRDYFRNSFGQVNENNRKAATGAGIANGLLAPLYTFAANMGTALILIFSIQILIIDKLQMGVAPEFGTLLAFILYSSTFFGPLKEMAELFTQVQVAVSSWSRIYTLLRLETNLVKIENNDKDDSKALMKFHNVSFGYQPEQMILNKINMDLEEGHTYALVGPTGGGKSTTASLMARLYDVSEGQVFYRGKNIKTYSQSELSKEIGFILQEPFLFSGSIADNIKYGNEEYKDFTEEELTAKLKELGLESIVEKFNEGLSTAITTGAENISLGQRQLINFLRILLRQPKLLILDEATANIDTITEQLLEAILNKLSDKTTKVIIAHRLNTIENADQIFFISSGTIEKPVNFDSALDLINAQGQSKS